MWRSRFVVVSAVCMVVGSFLAPTAFAQDELANAKSREAYIKAVMEKSPQQRKDESIKRINTMKASEKSVNGLRDEERENGQEITKLNCINDKLSLIKGHINLSEKAYLAMDEAEQKNDASSVGHHYTLIAVSYGKVADLEQEANLCVGKQNDISESGTSILIEADDIVPVDPVLPGGYTQLEDIFGDIYDTTGLTPIR